MASVNSSGNATAGESLTLMCSITRAQGIVGAVTLQWIGPDGSPVLSGSSVTVGTTMTSGATTSLSLQFVALFTSHGGEYTCQANLMSQSTMYTVSTLHDIIVRGTAIFTLIASHLPFPAVPAPSVVISGVPTTPLYAGTSLLLTCTIELHGMIDSEVTLNSFWRRGGEVLSPNSRLNISTIRMTSSSTYQTTLTISPLSNTMDSGQYSCQSVLRSDDYVLYTDGSQQVTVTVRGEH